MARACLVAALALLTCIAAPAPGYAAPRAPSLERASAALLVDAEDGEPILRKDVDERRAIASATKLMTALLALERAPADAVFSAAAYDALPVESKIGLRRGERMRLEDLLEALLLESANDAAVTIAEGVSGSRAAFVAEMNERARALGLTGTSFANPIGLDHPDNYSTARDLARLAVRLMRDRRFARIVDMPSAVLESGSRRRVVDNRNLLVARHPFVDGIKTGHTQAAGYVLVGTAGGRGGARVVSVVLGEPSESARDADTLTLLRYGLSRFRTLRALRPDRPVTSIPIEHRDDKAEVVPRRTVTVTARRDETVRTRVSVPDELEGPLPAGIRVGSVTVLEDGRPVARAALFTASEVPGAGPLRVLESALGLPLTLLLALAMLIAGALVAQRMRVRAR